MKKPMAQLGDITHLIVDMDGVLYRGNDPLPRLQEFIAFLRQKPIPFILATNNSTQTPQQYAAKLACMGAQVSPTEILTSGQATARFLARHYPPGTRAHVFGMPSLRQAMEEAGFFLADENVAVVVASMDREITYDKLKRASLLIRGGARFIVTNLDPTLPSAEGLLPGTGSLIAALQAATGIKPLAIGKPEPTMFQLALEMMGARPQNTATLGDRVDTDLEGGRRAGLATIGVLSGSSNREEMEAFGADWIFADISRLLDALQAAHQGRSVLL
jgi:4-nitrophenyl phosphatase